MPETHSGKGMQEPHKTRAPWLPAEECTIVFLVSATVKSASLAVFSAVLGLLASGEAVSAQYLYMNPNTGSVYNGYGLPVSGPNPGRVMQYNSTPSYQRNYFSPNGSTMNGYGLPTSGPNQQVQFCLRNPSFC